MVQPWVVKVMVMWREGDEKGGRMVKKMTAGDNDS